jgi:hypothetical protein
MPENEPETLLHVNMLFSEVGRMLGGTSARPDVPVAVTGTSGLDFSVQKLARNFSLWLISREDLLRSVRN